ncbi:2-oxoacid:acceptor oxidoreductase family protein, partial [Bacteroidota bacterium]
LIDEAGLEVKVFADTETNAYQTEIKENRKALFSDQDAIQTNYENNLKKPLRLLLCGSVGEGTQLAAEFLLKAGMLAGLNATKKGSYPVTVGVGFSAAEIILSPEEILYTGSPDPDVVCVTSQDGLDYARNTIRNMSAGQLLIDSSLEIPDTKAEVFAFPFREKVGVRNSSIYSIFYYLKNSGVIPIDALVDVFNDNKISNKLNVAKMLEF